MAADGEAVVAGEDDEGLPCLPARREGVEDAADLGVEVLDRGVVVGKVPADDLWSPRPRGELLVTNCR